MRVRRKRVGRAGVGFNQNPVMFAGFNGKPAGGEYRIGMAYSLDRSTWSTYGGSLIQNSGSGYDSLGVKDPSLLWDGTKWVCYFGGYTGSPAVFAIGRATAQHPSGPWTKYASNPVVPHGSPGDPDEVGCEFPVVHFDAADTPKWRMWYIGYPATSNIISNPIGTTCYAESSDGITWTKFGTVIPRGAGGSFNEVGSYPGFAYKSGSTWYVYFCGFRATDFFARSAYATTTSPSSAGSYSAPTQLSNYTGNVTVGGRTWQSNLPRGLLLNPNGSTYSAWAVLWRPTDTSTILETCVQVTSPDLVSFPLPSGLMLPFDSWDNVSAENPSIVVSP